MPNELTKVLEATLRLISGNAYFTTLIYVAEISVYSGMSTLNKAVFLLIKPFLLLRFLGDPLIYNELLISLCGTGCIATSMYFDPMLNIRKCLCVCVSNSVHD